MAPRNSRSNRPTARSSRSPQSARAVRTAKAAQSGRIASRGDAARFSRGAQPSGYRPAYTPGSNRSRSNGAYGQGAGQYSRNNPHYSRAAKKAGRGKKIAIALAAVLLVAIVGTGTAFAMYMNSVNRELNTGTKTEEELQAIADTLAPKKSFNEPFYLMLIGSDRRVGDDSMGARSDTNIVTRVDPTQNLVTMVSIPRDTMIYIDDYGQNKFNAAYNFGGAASTIREASQLTGAEISHYAEVNFEELVSLVDAVGGVDVEVDVRIDDTDADNTTGNPYAERIIIEEGLQHLDGEAALVYARSRAFPDGDFTRTRHQRTLIKALVDKVLSLPVTELPGVISAAAKCVTTDLSVSDIIALAEQFKDKGEMTMYSAMVPSTTGYIGDISYVFTDETALKQMMQIVEEGGDPSGITGSSSAAAAQSGASSGPSGGSGYSGGYDDSYGYDSGYDSDYDSGYDPTYSGEGDQSGGSDYVDNGDGAGDPGLGGSGTDSYGADGYGGEY